MCVVPHVPTSVCPFSGLVPRLGGLCDAPDLSPLLVAWRAAGPTISVDLRPLCRRSKAGFFVPWGYLNRGGGAPRTHQTPVRCPPPAFYVLYAVKGEKGSVSAATAREGGGWRRTRPFHPLARLFFPRSSTCVTIGAGGERGSLPLSPLVGGGSSGGVGWVALRDGE
jgi:hypothetical protein